MEEEMQMNDFMKGLRAIVAIAFVVSAAALAIREIHGWGWFVLGALLVTP
jgi:hypothetical protein